MHIRYLSLTNFRNYARLELTLPERPLLLYGANAQGKTSLLEAIYLLATGSSPLTSLDRQLIRWEAEEEGLPYARVWAEVVRRDRIQEIEIVLENKPLANGTKRLQKTIRVDRARKRRADLAGQLNVVVFMPQDVELVAGPPAGRRRVAPPPSKSLPRPSGAAPQRGCVRSSPGRPGARRPRCERYGGWRRW